MNNLIKFLEKMWLMVAIVSIVIATYKTIYVALEDGLFFYMFSVLAAVLWLLRRRMRRRMEAQQAKANQE